MREIFARCVRLRCRTIRPRRWIGTSGVIVRLGYLDRIIEVCYLPNVGYRPLRCYPWNCPGNVIADWSDLGDAAVKKRVVGAGSAGGSKHLAPLESVTFGKLFKLVEHCAVRQYDDGSERQAGWFTVKTVGSAWVVQVKDPDACASLTATASTLDDALALADLLLATDDAPWESDPWLKRKRPGAK